MTENAAVASSWVRICPESELEENWGEVALVKGQQYAIFKTKHGYYACDHRDPNSQSLVIARGIVGEKDGHSTIFIKRYTISLRVSVSQALTIRSVCTL